MSRPKILFVVPKTPVIARRPALERLWKENARFRNSSFFFPIPNLGLLTLAGGTGEEFDIEYRDENIGPGIPDGPYDIVAVTSMTCQAPRAYRICSAFKKRGSHVVLGGMHPTMMPREALGHADTVIAGEGEMSWSRFLDDYLRGRPEGLYEAGAFTDLARARPPRYDLVARLGYRAMPVQVGRGCPMGCEFCSVEAVHGRRYRHKEIRQVVEEVKTIKRLRPAGRPRIFFTDDNLHLHRGLMGSLLEALIPLKINWMAQMDISVGEDTTLLDLMSRSGCSQLLVGLESLDARNLDMLQPGGVKPGHLENYGRLIEAIQSRGIRVLGMFIVGLDNDDPGVFTRLRDFIMDNVLHDAQITIQTPLPGTKLYERLAGENRLVPGQSWSRFNFFNVVFEPSQMTGRQLLRGQSWLYGQIHSRAAVRRRQKYWLDHFRGRGGRRAPRSKD